MPIYSYSFSDYHDSVWLDIDIFMKQAYKLTDLTIQRQYGIDKLNETIEKIISIVPSRIEHLNIPIENLNQIKTIVERCENLARISFFCSEIKLFEEVKQWFSDNTINTTYQCPENSYMVSVWLEKKKKHISLLKYLLVENKPP